MFALTAVASALPLAWLYLADLMALNNNPQWTWCTNRYGDPEQFDYLQPDRTERIGAAVVDFWGWYPPGMTCRFGDSHTGITVVVGPEHWRGHLALALAAVVALSVAGYIVTRKRSRTPKQRETERHRSADR
ncbi:hypothetical protein DW322_15585 [Rhodococcus rhodnii]|uniref:Uncharacterized protein n=3 Tax=Rhodococcus rhodnii TaxID=38312 RepID=R7WTK9_9NOCA|nr:hypothetical protein Rrhod_0131 [Rhodococcus rhodnii LMG 5362]TXG91374.1 hypothetical protein DW322_15585 [Rhodococcus rhodnii]